MKAAETLVRVVNDKSLIHLFFLDKSLDALIEKMRSLSFSPNEGVCVPFNAQLRDYRGATDSDGECWIIKQIAPEEAFFFRLCELVYYMDFEMETLSAPTICTKIGKDFFRATKVIPQATQISGYNYLEEPIKKVLARDLINRWLSFDEDRNPNNYLVRTNSMNLPLIVAIDFNHIDLESEKMKITGEENRFGWIRTEKTRFLTLLKPENFDKYSIEDFESRLELMMKIPEKQLIDICHLLFKGVVTRPESKSSLIVSNIVARRAYIDGYFRKFFLPRSKDKSGKNDAGYLSMGKSFVDYYEKKN
jgi:hypothetical protein